MNLSMNPMIQRAIETMRQTALLPARVEEHPATAQKEFILYRNALKQPSFVMDVLNIWYYGIKRPTETIYQNWRVFFVYTMLNHFVGSLHAQIAPLLSVDQFKKQQLNETVEEFKSTERVEQREVVLQNYVTRMEQTTARDYAERIKSDAAVLKEKQATTNYYLRYLWGGIGSAGAAGALAWIGHRATRWIGNWWGSSSSPPPPPPPPHAIAVPVIVAAAQEKAREMAVMPNWSVLGTILLATGAAAATYVGGRRLLRRRLSSHHRRRRRRRYSPSKKSH